MRNKTIILMAFVLYNFINFGHTFRQDGTMDGWCMEQTPGIHIFENQPYLENYISTEHIITVSLIIISTNQLLTFILVS